MTCFHTPYLILSHVPFSLSYLLYFFGHFGQEGNHGHLGLLGLEPLAQRGRHTEDYLLQSNVQLLPYQGVHPSRRHRVDTLLDDLPGQLQAWLNPLQQSTLRLGKSYNMRPQSNRGLQDIDLPFCVRATLA